MNITQQKTDIVILKRYIFDPLSTIIKLSVLKNKPIGTKIAIKDNIIYIQEMGMFQSIVRYYNGNTKSDIHYLSDPIRFACEKYLTAKKLEQIPDIILIFKSAQDGLNNLMQTYTDYPIIVHCLKYYHSIIESHINSLICDENCILKNKNKQPNIHLNIQPIIQPIIQQPSIQPIIIESKQKIKKNKQHSEIIEHLVEDVDTNELLNLNSKNNEQITNEQITNEQSEKIEIATLYDNFLDKFNLIWTESKINIILGMIKYLIGESSPIDYVKCIETFIIPIDNEVYNIIHN